MMTFTAPNFHICSLELSNNVSSTNQDKTSFYWFEVLECARRLSLASIIGIVSQESAAAPVLGIIISAAFTWVSTALRPFKDDSDNTLGVVLAYALMFFFLSALLIKVEATDDDERDQDVFAGLLFVCLFSGPFALIIKGVEGIWRKKTTTTKEQGSIEDSSVNKDSDKEIDGGVKSTDEERGDKESQSMQDNDTKLQRRGFASMAKPKKAVPRTSKPKAHWTVAPRRTDRFIENIVPGLSKHSGRNAPGHEDLLASSSPRENPSQRGSRQTHGSPLVILPTRSPATTLLLEKSSDLFFKAHKGSKTQQHGGDPH